MNTEILLDRRGDLPAPSGYQVIESEVDFLRYATGVAPLLIRGERLCAWAEAFFSLRGRSYRYQESLSAALQRTFSALSQEQASGLSQKMGLTSIALEQASVTSILNCCYPADFSLWQGDVSPEHSARWLLWLYSHHPDDAEKIILERFTHGLEAQAGNTPEGQVYRATNREQAQSLLHAWLGLGKDKKGLTLGNFPLSLPDGLLHEIKLAWTVRLIESEGGYFMQMLDFPLPVALRQELAQLTAQFYDRNSKYLSREILWLLQPYLSSQTLAALEDCLPPPEPGLLPEEEADVLGWFQSAYLPYRRWQARHGDEQPAEHVRYHAQTFAHWYLTRYPQWLLQSKWISFQQSAHLQRTTPNAVTLCLVLDGLPAWDAEDFARSIFARMERLQLQQKSYCFAPLPTVTEFAKDALLKGVPPRLVPSAPPLGKILPDKESPLQGLKDAQPGDLVFWRVGQPDAAYHFAADAKRERQVGAELDSIIRALKEVVENLPLNIPLQVIVTSDHGRLLNAKSPRRLPVPDGMQVHGRVAWGSLGQEFDESGFLVDENAGWIDVHGERFEMSHDMLIALGEDSFQNIKTGSEPYPHGGLFPEEAIIPWFVFERDAQQPDLQIVVSGTAEAGDAGSITVTITNPSQVALECFSVSFSHGAQVSGYWSILPLDKTEFTIRLTPWPTKADLITMKTTLLFRQPNGATFTIGVTPSLEVVALYERDDTLLKDLDL
jgi:hypothetical protein